MRSRRVRYGGWAARLAAPASVLLAVSLVGQPSAQAAPFPGGKPGVLGVKTLAAQPIQQDRPGESRAVRGAAKVVWPQGTATVELAGAPAAGSQVSIAAGRVQAGTLPVRLGTPAQTTRSAGEAAVAKATVTVHDRGATGKAGVKGLMLSLNRADGASANGTVNVQVGYGDFADAYGGDWATRLRLVAMPACVLSAPQRAECHTATPLSTKRDHAAKTVTADAQVPGSGPVVLAVTAAADGDNGSFSATTLSQAGSWNVGAQTGDFTWSYPLRMPPAVAGATPSLALSYSSGSVDGRVATSNNQGGWIGDGWEMWPGFVERKYASCADDNPGHKTGDQCWFNDNATLSLSGHAGELIATGTPNRYKLKRDDGTRVDKIVDAARANGDNDNEYWKVTTTDGMQYFFGYHRLPGWVSGNTPTESVWTVPVYGNNDLEPCHGSSFANSRCAQAWRWNLDYVIDPFGNTVSYFYGKEIGWYGRDNTPSQRTEYVRGGWLDHIDYGTRHGSEYAATAPVRVQFDVKERCLADCWNGTPWQSTPKEASWRDTPWDQDCPASPCTDNTSPTFWSARRLWKITTQIRTGATPPYRDVESWTLRQEFLNAGDNEGFPMWLSGITRAGHVTTAGGTAASDPEIVFGSGSEPLPNRVEAASVSESSLTRFRIKNITTESGGQINVTYAGGDCTRASLPARESNTTRCMPGFKPSSGDTPRPDWFHKYVVRTVNLHDVQYSDAAGNPVANNPDQMHFYEYLDTPAWHYADDEITPDKNKTWSDWRGYGQVKVGTGPASGPVTATEYRYLRGMDGDKLDDEPGSGVRDVWVADTWGGSVEDHEALQGYVRQKITYLGATGPELSSEVMDPWLNGPTATRTRNEVTTNAWTSNTATTRTRTRLAAPPAGPGGWRYVKTTVAFNGDGQPVTIDSFGDENLTGDETCKRTTYVRNDTTWMIDKVSQEETLSGTCAAAATPAAPATVLSRTRTFFDTYLNDTSFGAAPTFGNVVRTEALDRFSGSTPVYKMTSTNKYDTYGRLTETADALGRKTTTGYGQDPVSGLNQTKTFTNALSHRTIATLEPAWGSVVRMTDANDTVTETSYDGLGRLIAMKLPGHPIASLKVAYQVRATGGPTTVTSERLLPNGTAYHKTVSLLDGFLRQRQTQAAAPGGGRVLTETLHNAIGQVDWTSLPFYDSTNTAPNTTLGAPSGAIPSVTRTDYDGASRPTVTVLLDHGGEKWRGTTIYDGDLVAGIPPQGGTTTQQKFDAFGRVKELRQYTGTNPTGSFHTTSYGYTLLSQLKTVTDPTGNRWSYDYDLHGRQISSADPDAGTITTTYDAAGQVKTVTRPVGTGTGTTTVAFTYDDLGRKTSLRDDTVTGVKRAEWLYDTLPFGKGKLTSATRYIGGQPYVSRVDNYDNFSQPTSTSVVLPSSESDLCAAAAPNTCTYTTAVEYKPNGQLFTTTLPAAANLASEKLTFGYTGDTGHASSVLSPIQKYVGDVVYNQLGQLQSRNLGNTGSRVAMVYDYDEPTRRVKTLDVFPEGGGADAANYAYTYDPAGNVIKISDTAGTADHQCFGYDYLRRLTEAWTPDGGDCAAAKSVAALRGPQPYWHSWTFDVLGNRRTETRHGATDTVYTLSYPAPGLGVARPHAHTNVTASGGQAWSRNYSYDNAGNTISRPASSGATQTLTWDREGKVQSLTQGSATTTNIYDADGGRLIRKDADGSKTLYLPNGTEVRSVGTVKTATRYYSHAGTTVAMRTGAGVHWIVGDHHGTAEVTIKASDRSVAKRRMLPYGEQRGTTSGTWAAGMDKGFLGATADPTELVHIGARQYDTRLGRFISVDPIMDLSDPQQMHGYAYSNNNPTSFSDPSGLAHEPGEGGGGSGDGGYLTTSNGVTYEYNTTSGYLCVAGGAGEVCATVAKIGSPCDINTENVPKFLKKVNEIAADTAHYDMDTPDGQLRILDRACAETNACVMGFDAKISDAANMAVYATVEPTAFSEWLARHPELVEAATSGGGAVGGAGIKMFRNSGGRGRPNFNSPNKTNNIASCKNSFDAETPVLLGDGTSKKIKDIRLGEHVLATDPTTGKTSSKPVTALHLNLDTELTRLTVTDERGNPNTIDTTWEHPFWSPTRGQWVLAADLNSGETLLGPHGEPASIIGVANSIGSQPMYNLTVARTHTYYVTAGNTPVLVHNDSECRTMSAGDLVKSGISHPIDKAHLKRLDEQLSDEDLLNAFDNPLDGDRVMLTRGGTLVGGHHRVFLLEQRIKSGRIDPNRQVSYEFWDERID